jgi:hypothetical protein
MDANTSQVSHHDTYQRADKVPTTPESAKREENTQQDIEKRSTDTAPATGGEIETGVGESRMSTPDRLDDVGSINHPEVESTQYLSTWRASLLTLGLCLVTFATAVDNTIIGMHLSQG